jgi:hypothetical protein
MRVEGGAFSFFMAPMSLGSSRSPMRKGDGPMAIKISPYIHFSNGEAEQAIHLYVRALGAKVEALMRYAEMPGRR